MKSKLMFPAVFVGLVGVACGGDGVRRGDQTSYETVQEGSAAGVTSTIHGPGEVLPPITGTNADTTSAFSIDPTAVAGATPALPPPQISASPAQPMPQPQPAPSPVSVPATQPQPEPESVTPPRPKPEPAPEPQPEPLPPPTQTSPPTPTDTDVAPPQEEPEEEEPPPPPPTTTDTRGQ